MIVVRAAEIMAATALGLFGVLVLAFSDPVAAALITGIFTIINTALNVIVITLIQTHVKESGKPKSKGKGKE